MRGDLLDAIRIKDIKKTLLILDAIKKTYPNLLNGEEDDNKNTILHDIIDYIKKPNTNIFNNILKLIDPNIVNIINLDDYTALHYAIKKNNISICKMLIPKMDLEALTYNGGYGCHYNGCASYLANYYGMLSIKVLIDKRIEELENNA
jgi:ankyrin repeat protein